VVLLASVNFAGRTSMEIGVKVWQEQRSTGDRKHVASAYLTFVSLDPESRAPRPVPPVLPETEDEKRRFAAAQQRRANRLQARK
jgi:acyl-CoA hydrolase